MELAELVALTNGLREKQLNGGGLTDEEVLTGIRYIVQIRRLRAGKGFQNELPAILNEKISELF